MRTTWIQLLLSIFLPIVLITSCHESKKGKPLANMHGLTQLHESSIELSKEDKIRVVVSKAFSQELAALTVTRYTLGDLICNKSFIGTDYEHIYMEKCKMCTKNDSCSVIWTKLSEIILKGSQKFEETDVQGDMTVMYIEAKIKEQIVEYEFPVCDNFKFAKEIIDVLILEGTDSVLPPCKTSR